MLSRRPSHKSTTNQYPFAVRRPYSQRSSTAPLPSTSPEYIYGHDDTPLSHRTDVLQDPSGSRRSSWFDAGNNVLVEGGPRTREALSSGLKRMFTRTRKRPEDKTEMINMSPVTHSSGTQPVPPHLSRSLTTDGTKHAARPASPVEEDLPLRRKPVDRRPVLQHKKKSSIIDDDDIVIYRSSDVDRPKRRATTATTRTYVDRVATTNSTATSTAVQLNHRASIVYRLGRNDMLPYLGPTPYSSMDENRPALKTTRRHSAQPTDLQACLARQSSDTQRGMTDSRDAQQEVFAATSALQRMFSRRQKEVAVKEDLESSVLSHERGEQVQSRRPSLSFSVRRSSDGKTGPGLVRRISQTLRGSEPQVTSSKPTKKAIRGDKPKQNSLDRAGAQDILEKMAPTRKYKIANPRSASGSDSEESLVASRSRANSAATYDANLTPRKTVAKGRYSPTKSAASRRKRAALSHRKNDSATSEDVYFTHPDLPTASHPLARASQDSQQRPGSPTPVPRAGKDWDEEECLLESDDSSVLADMRDGRVETEINVYGSVADMYIGTLYGEYLSETEDDGAEGRLMKTKAAQKTKAPRQSKRWSMIS